MVEPDRCVSGGEVVAVFTGIIETVGSIERVDDLKQARGLRIEAPAITPSLSVGDSVAVDGVCLTVESCDAGALTATVPQPFDPTPMLARFPIRQTRLEDWARRFVAERAQ